MSTVLAFYRDRVAWPAACLLALLSVSRAPFLHASDKTVWEVVDLAEQSSGAEADEPPTPVAQAPKPPFHAPWEPAIPHTDRPPLDATLTDGAIIDFGEETRTSEFRPWWREPIEYRVLPGTLLWQIPLANQREPRTDGKFLAVNGQSTVDTAIGGQFGLLRFGPKDRSFEGIQIDGFAAVFTRFNDRRLLTAADYRVGLPLTFASGPWQAKFSYEHTSTHLGDEFIQSTGRLQKAHVRDELVWGLARWLHDEIRLYGQVGYSFHTSKLVGNDRMRYDWGLEWSKQAPTSWKGRPFAAYDMDLRSDQSWTINSTVQLGWQWRTIQRRSARMAAEFYNGRSPYGQFYRVREQWIGFGAYLDW